MGVDIVEPETLKRDRDLVRRALARVATPAARRIVGVIGAGHRTA